MNRMKKPLRRLIVAAAGLAAVATSAVVAPPAHAAPPTPDFPSAIEGYAGTDSQDTCDPSAKPGPIAMRDMLNAEYGRHSSGIGRDCRIGDASEHKEGRALDYGFNYFNSADRADAEDMIAWLLATDRHGNRHANARRLGVMYIIWNRQIWSASGRARAGGRTAGPARTRTMSTSVSAGPEPASRRAGGPAAPAPRSGPGSRRRWRMTRVTGRCGCTGGRRRVRVSRGRLITTRVRSRCRVWVIGWRPVM